MTETAGLEDLFWKEAITSKNYLAQKDTSFLWEIKGTL